MEHKNRAIGRNRALKGRLKMTGENVRLADPVVGEKTICGLGISPVLAHQRDALADGAPDLRHQFAEPLIQALVDKTAASKLAIKPCVVFPVHRHRSSRESVPDEESRSIPVTQHFVRSSDHSAKCG